MRGFIRPPTDQEWGLYEKLEYQLEDGLRLSGLAERFVKKELGLAILLILCGDLYYPEKGDRIEYCFYRGRERYKISLVL